MRIVYLIIAHKNIEQVYRQIDVLSAPDSFFYIHIDRKTKLKIEPYYTKKENVTFINKKYKVYWGGFNSVRAEIDLLKEAFNHKFSFDYYVLLSGQCFPIKSNKKIFDFFKKNNGKSFIEIKTLPYSSLNEGDLDKFYYLYFFDQLGFLPDRLPFRKKTEWKKLLFRWIKKICNFLNLKRGIPENLIPCFGSQWWALYRDAVKYILNIVKQDVKLVKFFRYTWAPDELFFQTLLYNSPLKHTIENQSLWYIDWNTNGPPKTLRTEDYEFLVKSDKLFARKFDINDNGSKKLIDNLIKIL